MRRNSPASSAALFSAAFATLMQASCSPDPAGRSDDLTSAEAVEREVVIKGQVFVDSNASAYTIQSAVQRQVRTAFGPLRIAKISVDDREFKKNVDPQSFNSEAVTVVKRDNAGALTTVKQAKRVSYTYKARGLVNKQHQHKESFSLALLMGNYQTFVDDIIHDCVEDYDHDAEFASSFWYVFAANEWSCRQLIEEESTAIATARQGLAPGQVSELEYQRRFLPIAAELNQTGTPPTTYPEYHRLYGIGDASKDRVRVYAVFGVASHAEDPEEEQFEGDIGFAEFFKTIKVLTDKFARLRLAETSPSNPLTFSFKGQDYVATSFDQLKRWVIDGSGLPGGITGDDKQAFRRAIHDHLHRRWIRLEVPLEVSAGAQKKAMVLELDLIFGTNSDYQSRAIFRQSFEQGEVVIYDGHSYIGSGPLDPSNYYPSNFRTGYQIFLFNSCVSFNYYNVDYFDHKANGSKDLELVTNGIESYIYDGGKSMGQFIVALFDGAQNSWLEVLDKTRVPWWSTGYHDPNRAVDGELDNEYDPATTPLTVSERDWTDDGDGDNGDNGGGGGGGGEGEVLFVDDMETAASSWTATGLWHHASASACAAPGAASGEGAWYFGDEASCTFKGSGGRQQGTLTSAPIADVSATSRLSFKFYRQVEQASSGNYDQTEVQVAEAGSDSWTTVWTRNAADASEQAWLGTDGIDLAAFAGKTIQLRFAFDSRDGYANNHTGWLVDDVTITK